VDDNHLSKPKDYSLSQANYLCLFLHPDKGLAVSPLQLLGELTLLSSKLLRVPQPFRVLASLVAPLILRLTGVTRYPCLLLFLDSFSKNSGKLSVRTFLTTPSIKSGARLSCLLGLS